MLDERAAADVAAHLDRLDRAVPGLVVALHVIGSATLHDYHPDTSDLDLYAEVAHPVTPGDLTAITTAHTGEGLRVEAVYLPAGALNESFEHTESAPWVRDGEPHIARSAQLHAVTRLQLASYSATVRGTPPAITGDVPAAQEFCRNNLASYWQRLIDTGADAVAGMPAGMPAPMGATVWLGLGPARLWHTIRTGEIVSKSRAGELAAEHWPDLAEPLRDIIAVRAGKQLALTTEHSRAAVTLGQRVLADC